MGLRGPKPRTIEQIIEVLRLNSSYKEETNCFLWHGNTAGEGYGVVSYNGKGVYIHRLVYWYVNDEEPEVVRHTCDTPTCWNPDHLQNGSHADNVLDKIVKGRQPLGEQRYNAHITEQIVREIRSSDLSPVELAKKYNVHRAIIHDVRKRNTWKHVK